MEHQLATKSTQKEQSEKPAFSSTLQPKPAERDATHPVLRLQRAVGNQAVQRLLNSGDIQTRLPVGQPGDRYEQEADRMAQQVVTSPSLPTLQRSAANSTNTNQSSTASTTVPPLQQKGRGQSPPSDTLSQNQSPLQEAPHQKENTTGLPDALKAGVESLSGMSMDDVNVHYHSSKPAEIQALAYTQGTDIHVGPGQEHHLAHEAWHVVQQKQGQVKPTLQAKGVPINDDEGLEREADVMGKKAVQKQFVFNPGEYAMPRTITQRKPLDHEIKHLSPRNMLFGTYLLRKVSGIAAPSAGMTVQREVKKVWGKWKSTYDMTQEFGSEEEARAFDQQAAAAAEAAAEVAWAAKAEAAAWKFSDANNRLTTHFKDGWGAAYGIQSYEQIKERIIAEKGSEEIGIQEVYLGHYTVKKVPSECNIMYENKWISLTVGSITRNMLQSDVFHCGPGKGY